MFNRGEDLIDFLYAQLKGNLEEGDVVALSSKIVSYAENCFVKQSSISKKDLVKKEADSFLGEVGYNIFLTIKHGLFIPSAGIDASNAGVDNYVLFPKNPFASAKNIWNQLKEKFKYKNLGVILVDSHTTPLRRGTTGIGLAYWGFSAVRDYRGKPDLFNKKLEYTFLNVVDSLSVMANYAMGEGAEQIPLVVVRQSGVAFSDTVDPKEIQIPAHEDLYYPIFKNLIDID